MELRHLRYFVAVAEELHFGRAAERLQITPPSLTQQIQNLEAELGVRLINRTNRTVKLSDAGARFLDEARKTIRQAENAELVARRAGRGEVGRIEVAYMTTASCSGVVARVLSEYAREHPMVDVRLRKLETPEQLEQLAEGRLDFGFLRPPERYPLGLAGRIVWRQPLIIALPESHRLAGRKKLECHELADEVFIVPSVESEIAFRGYASAVAEAGGFTPRVLRRAQDYLSIVTLVSVGYGIAAVPWSFSKIDMPGVRYVEIYLDGEARIACAYRRQENSPPVQRLINAMKKMKLQE